MVEGESVRGGVGRGIGKGWRWKVGVGGGLVRGGGGRWEVGVGGGSRRAGWGWDRGSVRAGK